MFQYHESFINFRRALITTQAGYKIVWAASLKQLAQNNIGYSSHASNMVVRHPVY